MTPTEIKQKLAAFGIRPAKIRGQNFLIDERVLREIVNAADLTKEDSVLEIGPGLGVLTLELLNRAGSVTAVEIDELLARSLEEQFKSRGLVVMRGDIQLFATEKLLPKIKNHRFKLVANIPYNITSAVLEKFLQEEPSPSLIVLLVQREVAERIMASDGKMSRLAVFVQYFGKPEIIRRVSRESFWPAPKVESAILRIRRYPDEILRRREISTKREDFFRLVKIGFSSPRKKVVSNLSGGFGRSREEIQKIFLKANIPVDSRAENLSLEQWISLARFLYQRRLG